MISIGRTLKRFRSEQQLSQKELAERAGLTPSFLSLVENDKRTPSLVVISRLADALSLPEEILLWDAVEIPPDLSEKDRRLCSTAKLIVRRYYESTNVTEVEDQA